MAETTRGNAAVKSGEREKRLLVVVDGNNAHLYYTSMLLQRLDYNIHTANTAEDALEIVNVAHPALVLTEISLSGMDGLELLKKIKRNPQSFSVPVIVLTASKDQAVKADALQEGCAAYLQKPVEPDVLYATIQKMTESRPRQYIRLNTTLNVIVGDDKAAEFSGTGDYITALSEHGMYISTSKPKPVGLQIPITILLEDMKMKVEGMVLYSFQRGEGPLRTPGMGIKFVRISSEDQNVIKVYITREITKGLTMAHIGGTL
jgi:CheY-like chemotaxis protein/Tfp pilus assembly protein PilZ